MVEVLSTFGWEDLKRLWALVCFTTIKIFMGKQSSLNLKDNLTISQERWWSVTSSPYRLLLDSHCAENLTLVGRWMWFPACLDTIRRGNLVLLSVLCFMFPTPPSHDSAGRQPKYACLTENMEPTQEEPWLLYFPNRPCGILTDTLLSVALKQKNASLGYTTPFGRLPQN